MKQLKYKKNVVLADCPPDEIINLINGLSSQKIKFECISEIACGIRTGTISEIKRYLAYFIAGWHAFKKRDEYNIIIGWQQFYALIFCFYCNVFHVKKQNTVVALNYTYKEKKGIIGKLYLSFMRKCVDKRYLDYIHVLSREYADVVSANLNFPRERIIVTPFGVDDIYEQWKETPAPEGYKKNSYAMSIGRSNRDFDLLINAWKDIDYPLIIISDTFSSPKTLPNNVKLISNVAGDAQYPYIVNAKLTIIPIDEGKICSGDTVLLTALSFKQTVVVTTPSTLGEMYIKDGVNGYLVKKDTQEIISLVNAIISDKKTAVGENARESYLKNFSRYSMGKKVAEFIGEKYNV